MARMIDTRSATTLSVADAVLRLFDSGITEKAVILATLMGSYPTLTLYTIDIILRTRRTRNPKKKKAPKPKSAIEIATDEIQALCLKCPLHTYGRACVMPLSLCPYPEVVDLVKKRDELVSERKRILRQKRVSGGTIEYKRQLHNQNTNNVFDAFEQELDDLYNENAFNCEMGSRKLYSPGPIANCTLEGVVFKPDENKSADFSHKSLEDYAEVLSASYNPTLKRDSFGFPIDRVGFSRIFEKYKDLYANSNEDDYETDNHSDTDVDQELDSVADVDFTDTVGNEDEAALLEQQSLDHVVYGQNSIRNPYYADDMDNNAITSNDFAAIGFATADIDGQEEEPEKLETPLLPRAFEIPFEENIVEENSISGYTVIDGFDDEGDEDLRGIVALSEDDADIAIDSMSFVASNDNELEEAVETPCEASVFEMPVETNMFAGNLSQNYKTDDFKFKRDEDLRLEDFSDVLAPGILNLQKGLSQKEGNKGER